MVKLCIDWPTAYTYVELGDITFALAQLYIDNREYRDTLHKLRDRGREIMLDNGAWEFGTTMEPKKYIQVINGLKPQYAVVPDVMKDSEMTLEVATDFFNRWEKVKHKPSLMLAPQGKNIKELVKNYKDLSNKFAAFVDIVAIPKHIGQIINRVKFTDHLLQQAE